MKKGVIKFNFIGLMKCKSCGASITAETQKGHVYYHCTKKLGHCESKKFLREEDLLSQIDKIISKVYIDDDTKNKMIDRFALLAHEESKSSLSLSRQVQEKISELDKKMERLIDLFVEQEISEEDYKIKKAKILNDKQLLKEKLGEIEKGSGGWLEPSKNFVSTCNQASYVARQETPAAKRDFLKIIGSNFLLFDRTLFISYSYPYRFVAETEPAEHWGRWWRKAEKSDYRNKMGLFASETSPTSTPATGQYLRKSTKVLTALFRRTANHFCHTLWSSCKLNCQIRTR
jgi:hypothetical protein